jgi:hypothetical protein
MAKIIREDVVNSLQEDICSRKRRVNAGTLIYYRKLYLDNKRKGDMSIVVDEWDLYEEQISEQNKQKNKEKGTMCQEEINMSEKRVLVRLSRDYNVAEVEVTNIESIEDFNSHKEWALSQAKGLLDSYSDTPKHIEPKVYVEAVQNATKPSDGVYTKEHITTKFLKGGQINIALKALNSGRVTIDQVNNLQSWDEQQALLFPPRKY